MSAFMVEKDTINRIVCFLRHTNKFTFTLRKLGELGLSPIDNPDKLGQAMYKMNADAIFERYGDNTKETIDNFYHYETIDSSEMQVLKSLQCYLYQCSEGNIPETNELYKILNRFEHDFLSEIVSRSQMYKITFWG